MEQESIKNKIQDKNKSKSMRNIGRAFFIIGCCVIVFICIMVIVNINRERDELAKKEFVFRNLEGVWELDYEDTNGERGYWAWQDRSAGYQIEIIDNEKAIARFDKNNNNKFEKNEITQIPIIIQQLTYDSGTIRFDSSLWNVKTESETALMMNRVDANGNRFKQGYRKITD
jgi:hypothetical protein